MAKSSLASEEARRKAEERFRRAKQREGEAQTVYDELAKRQRAELAKTERLRALRLAKEAANAEQLRRTTEAKAIAAKAAQRRKSARTASEKRKPELV
jgi:hypothetical protein